MSLAVNDICFQLRGGPAFAELSFTLAPGELMCLIGPNGSGKSSLLKALTGIIPLTGGSVSFENLDFAKLSRRNLARLLAYIPQYIPPVPLRVYDALMLGRTPVQKFFPSRDDDAAVKKTLRHLGLQGWEDRFLTRLSGGERQKIYLGLALVRDCRLLLLDETASSLDIRYQLEVYDLLRRECREHGRSVIIAEHDLNLAARYGDRVLLMSHGQIAGDGRPDKILRPDLLRRVYGVDVQLDDSRPGWRIESIELAKPDGSWGRN